MIKSIVISALCIAALMPAAFAERISQCEWFVGADPGPGNGTAISVGSPAPQVAANFTAGTGSLAPGLYRVNIRCRTDTTQRWGMPSPALLVIVPGLPPTPIVCTQFEWTVDNGAPTPVDVTDGQIITLNQIVATNGLPVGLHRLRVRTTDSGGRTAQFSDNFFVVTSTNPVVVRQVTLLDYWFDTDSPTTLDVADAPNVSFNQILATANLSIGLHRLNLRARDDVGRSGQPSQAIVIVTSPFGTAQTRTITAAEYWVNADPGPGNGVVIPLPTDSTWNSPQESVSTVLTGLPVGLYQVGFRTRDDLGRWSQSTTDSLIVGPVLVISSAGNDIVLNWQSGAGASQFKIYRAAAMNGSYALVDSTTAQSYTDVGAASVAARQFYRVTFQTTALSAFRLPEERPLRP
ncbi:MAG TPA: hypothetical protein VGL38_06510 [bacterium]|jgi:hypothetical protein